MHYTVTLSYIHIYHLYIIFYIYFYIYMHISTTAYAYCGWIEVRTTKNHCGVKIVYPLDKMLLRAEENLWHQLTPIRLAAAIFCDSFREESCLNCARACFKAHKRFLLWLCRKFASLSGRGEPPQPPARQSARRPGVRAGWRCRDASWERLYQGRQRRRGEAC